MIELQGITKSFGSLQVLKGIDLTIGKGEVVSIVGPSGAGKTTLLQIMGTLDRPDGGSVRINGMDVGRLNERRLSAFRNKEIGFVFQFHQLLPEFTALENVMIPALIQEASAGTARKRAMEMLEMIKKDIAEVISKYMKIDTNNMEIQISNSALRGRGKNPTLYADIPILDLRNQTF